MSDYYRSNVNISALSLGGNCLTDSYVGYNLRIERFVSYQILESGKFKPVSKGYLGEKQLLASLIVEGPYAEVFNSLLVYHRDDFKNLWTLFETRGLDSNEEALVVYLPARFFLKRWLTGSLFISVYPSGAIEAMSRVFTEKGYAQRSALKQIPTKIDEYVPPGRDAEEAEQAWQALAQTPVLVRHYGGGIASVDPRTRTFTNRLGQVADFSLLPPEDGNWT